MSAVLAGTVPILRIFDVPLARAFYVDWLGFRRDREHRFGEDFPLHAQVSRGGCALHPSEHHGDACPGAALRLRVEGLDALPAEPSSRPRRHARPGIERQPWGERATVLTDPFGNRLHFVEPLIEPPAEGDAAC